MTAIEGGLVVTLAMGSFDRRVEADAAGLHRLIRRFRDGDPAAAALVWDAAASLLVDERDLRSSAIAAVPVPGHDGPARPAMVALVSRLTEVAGWHRLPPDAMVRLDPVGEAKRRLPRERTDELTSLRWCGGTVPPAVSTVILVDDVVASGVTLHVCAAALRRDGWTGEVRALVLARAL